MNAISRIAGVYLIVVAILVGAFGVVEPLLYTSTEQHPYSPWWENINPLTGIAVALGVMFGSLRKLNPDYAPGQKVPGYSWKATDVAFPVLAGALGVSMLRGEKSR